jgi:proteasome lid subunit RPN8/RPN11
MNELDYQRVDSEARARGLAVTAIYHSHVGADAYLSELDMRYAAHAAFPFPDCDHFVVSIVDQRVERIGVFLTRGRGAFEGHRAEASAS